MTSETLYIVRNNEGEITTLNKTPPNTGEYEALPPNHPDILRFLSQSEDNDIKSKLNLTDIEFIRVLDDLIDILIDRNIIHFTDFPGPAQEKLHSRSGLRRKLNSLDPFLNEDVEDIAL